MIKGIKSRIIVFALRPEFETSSGHEKATQPPDNLREMACASIRR
jgi:hypothetical protein